ncbi:MAG: group I intron-associated PD-(D/E)XK endonuclease [Candidatus Omnitrophica bacterium]|nr:group I intron-associated PD-(D/E)XK endonuclease [Candidatus Omnitrophota bacterium]
MHHTKEKADIGVAKVIGDLAVKGYVPCIPLSEHQPYDVVAISKTGDVFKLQVKYASLKAIRFEKTINNQNLHVKWADDYLKLGWESSETIRCTPEMAKT